MYYFQERLLSKENGNRDSNHPYDSIDYQGLNEKEIEFFKLVRKDDVDTIRERIRDGINFTARARDGITPLMIAVEYGFYEVVEEFLRWKVDITAREVVDAESAGEGLTAMNLAVTNKDYKMIELLLKNGGDINERSGFEGESPFLIAVFADDYDYMDFILKQGADINIELYNGENALIHAVLIEDKKLVRFLLENGVDINHRNITDLTALEIAKEKGLSEMSEFLIEAGAIDENRMIEHLVTICQDLYWWDNDIAFAYYFWHTDDGFLHIVVYAIGYLNKYLAMSDLHRFYIRKKGDEFFETYAGDDQNWFHYVRHENGKQVDERLNSYGRTLYSWAEIMIGPDKAYGPPNAVYTFEPAQSDEFDFESKYNKLSKFLLKYLSIVKNKIDSDTPSVDVSFKFSRYSERGWKFLGPDRERRSVLAKDEHVNLILNLLLKYYKY